MHFAMPCKDLHPVMQSFVQLAMQGFPTLGLRISVPDLVISDSSVVVSFCHRWDVGLVVVGPDAPLVAALANDLIKVGIPTFGPLAEVAALEGLKNFMKSTKRLQVHLLQRNIFKADGLAAGKGVIVAMTLEDAFEAVDSMLVKGDFGSAGCHVIVEEYLKGEASFFALVDGETAIPLECAQDHKHVGDGDTGGGILFSTGLNKRTSVGSYGIHNSSYGERNGSRGLQVC